MCCWALIWACKKSTYIIEAHCIISVSGQGLTQVTNQAPDSNQSHHSSEYGISFAKSRAKIDFQNLQNVSASGAVLIPLLWNVKAIVSVQDE